MATDLIHRFKHFISEHRLVQKGDSILLGVSGGVDSMVMFHLFTLIREEFDLKISIAHINHQLRGGESDADEVFVREIAGILKVPCYVEKVDVRSYAKECKVSKQVAARKLRYECFKKIQMLARANLIATAHNADDNAETVLINILRGAFLHGLAGIPIKNDEETVIRPLMFARRKEIEDFAKEFNIKYRLDSSNLSTIYYRNFMRHKILPAIERRVPDVIDILNNISLNARDICIQLDRIVSSGLNKFTNFDGSELYIDIQNLEKQDDLVQTEIIYEVLRKLNVEITAHKIDKLLELCKYTSGRRISVGKRYIALRNRDKIILTKFHKPSQAFLEVEIGKEYEFGILKISISQPIPLPVTLSKNHYIEYVDADALIGKKLVLRTWKPGDWFLPIGLGKKKKLSDFFIDQKIPFHLKSNIPILECNGDIVWICGVRLDERFKLTTNSRGAIKLEAQKI